MMQYVFLHGAACTADVFDAQVAAFSESLAFVLPGHDGPGSASTIAEFADAVEGILADHNVENVALCGSSMGGAIALEVALRRNPRVAALVLLDSGAKLRVAPQIFDAFEANFEAAARMLAGYFFAQPLPALIEHTLAMMRAVGAAQTLRDFRACNAFDVTDRLPEIEIPVLALTGEHDVMTPPKFGAFVADRVQHGEARILPGAGHLPMLEFPAETNMALRAFVEERDR
ncbi:MAG TPA: alpha/beta fold hydrolase [Thermoanaerobaculia bacterium]|nr:alpha/beta fold hydrolase [Thermoanaerobaculia bacterium]